MSTNPFAGWTEAKIKAHNERVAKGKLKICHDIAGGNHIYVDAEELKLLTKTSEHYPRPLRPSDFEDFGRTEKNRKYSVQPYLDATPYFDLNKYNREVKSFSVPLVIIGAKRMNRSDKGLHRPCIRQYMEFRNKLVDLVGKHPTPDLLNFRCWIPMPESWSKKKKTSLDGQPHKQRSDLDNLAKCLMDSLFTSNDSGVFGSEFQFKFWCREGKERIDIELVYLIPK